MTDKTMSSSQLPLTLIVATALKNGIGKNGALPWPMLKKEMGYFARVTKRVPTAAKTGAGFPHSDQDSKSQSARRNVVIMGRKTWDSIPIKFRPLAERTSIVISTRSRDELGAVPDDVVVASDILSGLETLDQFVANGKVPPAGRAFVIGGSSIYKTALELPQTTHILRTKIHNDYDCDTFFPNDLDGESKIWERRTSQDLQDFVGEEVPAGPVSEHSGEADVQFEFQLYERR